MLFPHLLYLSSPTTFKKFAEFINYHNLFPPPLLNTHSLSSISHSAHSLPSLFLWKILTPTAHCCTFFLPLLSSFECFTNELVNYFYFVFSMEWEYISIMRHAQIYISIVYQILIALL